MALCSGIGGLELGLSRAIPGYKTVCMVERESYIAAVLAERMQNGDLPEAPIWDDIFTFKGRPWHSKIDIISSGFPCQPFSLAGERGGGGDSRYLWPQVLRTICEVRPRLIFLENVPGLLTLGIPEVLGGLASAGYNAQWGVFSAAQVGAPHIRQRVFILAHSQRCIIWDKPRRKRGEGGQGARKPGDDSQAPRWEALPPICGSNDGAPYRLDRLGALGNAVCPQQAAYAFTTLSRGAGII